MLCRHSSATGLAYPMSLSKAPPTILFCHIRPFLKFCKVGICSATAKRRRNVGRPVEASIIPATRFSLHSAIVGRRFAILPFVQASTLRCDERCRSAHAAERRCAHTHSIAFAAAAVDPTNECLPQGDRGPLRENAARIRPSRCSWQNYAAMTASAREMNP